MLYNIELVSAIHQHESTIGTHMSLPSWTSLPSPTPSYPSRLLTEPLFEFPVQFSHSVVSESLWPHGLQHTRLPCPSPTPGAWSNSCSWRVGDAIQPSHPLSFPSPPVFNLAQQQGLFQWLSSLYQMTKVLEL